MTRTARIVGGVSIVAAPLLLGVGDLLRMRAEGPDEVGAVSEWGIEEATAQLISIEANRAVFEAAAWLNYTAALVTVPALVALWSLAVGRARGWAWAGAVVAALGVTGQMVHVVGYFGVQQFLAGQPDPQGMAELGMAWDAVPFNLAVFAPFFLAPLAWVVQVVALRRAQVVALWSVVSVAAGTAVLAVAGSQPWSTAVWMLALVAGFAPAAVAMLRAEPAAPPAEATATRQPAAA